MVASRPSCGLPTTPPIEHPEAAPRSPTICRCVGRRPCSRRGQRAVPVVAAFDPLQARRLHIPSQTLARSTVVL